jgi:hypothetical protein
METSFNNRLQLTLLAVATAGLVLLAALNFNEERHTQQPDDGVWWREAAGGAGLVADKVLPNSPAARAGIQEHDLLTGVSAGSDLHSGMQRHPLLAGVKELPDETDQRSEAEPETLPPNIKYTPVARVEDLERALYRTGSYFQIYYQISRNGIQLGRPVEVIPEPADRVMASVLRVIGLIYLTIGIYVLFRRWTAPRATHFYLF